MYYIKQHHQNNISAMDYYVWEYYLWASIYIARVHLLKRKKKSGQIKMLNVS